MLFLEHGDYFSMDNPSLTDIESRIHLMSENKGPSDLQVTFGPVAVGQPQLWILALNMPVTGELRWAVQYVKYQIEDSLWLAVDRPREAALFCEVICCGAPLTIRQECVINDLRIVLDSVRAFVTNGLPNQNQVWFDLKDSVTGI